MVVYERDRELKESPVCEGNTRANICDTAKGNTSLLDDAVSVLRGIETTLGGPSPSSDKNASESHCLLDEVMLQRDMLHDLNKTAKRIISLLHG